MIYQAHSLSICTMISGVIFCPLICLIMTIGNSAIIYGLWPIQCIWTYYCVVRCLPWLPVSGIWFSHCWRFVIVSCIDFLNSQIWKIRTCTEVCCMHMSTTLGVDFMAIGWHCWKCYRWSSLWIFCTNICYFWSCRGRKRVQTSPLFYCMFPFWGY